MLKKYKNGITLFSTLSIFALLFPPIIWETQTKILHAGFAFLFYIPLYPKYLLFNQVQVHGRINLVFLFLEIFIIFVLSLLFQLYFTKEKDT